MRTTKPAVLVQKIKTVFKCPHCGKDTSSAIDHIDLNVPDREIAGWHCGVCGMENILSIVNNTLMITPSLKKEIKLISLVRSFEPLISGDYIYMFVKTSARTDKKGVLEPLEQINANKEFWLNEHTCPSNWLRLTVAHNDDLDPHGLFQHVRTIVAPDAPHMLYTANGEESPDPEGNYDNCYGFNENVLRLLFPEVTLTSNTVINQTHLH